MVKVPLPSLQLILPSAGDLLLPAYWLILFLGPIEGSAFKVHVQPGKGSADHTVAFGPGTKGAKSGEVAPITVEVRDLNDNRVTTGGHDLKGLLTYKGDGPADPVDVKVKGINQKQPTS
jgi:hypothetical protein